MPTNEDIQYLTALIHGASTHKSKREERIAFGSSVVNRLNSQMVEFGSDGLAPMSIKEVIHSNTSPYYESNGENERFNEVMNMKVAPYNEEEAKRNLQISSGLLKGTIPLTEGQFFYTDKEIEKLTKNKGHDFSKTPQVGRAGRFNLLSYGKKPRKKKVAK